MTFGLMDPRVTKWKLSYRLEKCMKDVDGDLESGERGNELT